MLSAEASADVVGTGDDAANVSTAAAECPSGIVDDDDDDDDACTASCAANAGDCETPSAEARCEAPLTAETLLDALTRLPRGRRSKLERTLVAPLLPMLALLVPLRAVAADDGVAERLLARACGSC